MHISCLGHNCKTPGRGRVFILDGNMKNHRDVCFAKEAGYVEYHGLPGKIQTGCPNTPALNSRYCTKHIPTTVSLNDDSDTRPKVSQEQQGIVIGKKTTRQSTLYEVRALIHS